MSLIKLKRVGISLVVGVLLAAVAPSARAFAQAMSLRHYKMTFNQNFTTMKTLKVSNLGPISRRGPTWIAHTPYDGDWVNFEVPSGTFHPFSLAHGYLTIRAQAINGHNYGGMLSSVDAQGNGFSQQYGYFEMKAKLPTGPGTWPAFWLMSVPALLDRSKHMDEIDVAEQWGNSIADLFSTLHLWNPNPWDQLWSSTTSSNQPTMTTGFHSYGVDIQPDFITFYYDRQRVGQLPNAIPGYTDKFDEPMYIMIDLAYGGGAPGITAPNQLAAPQDLQVKYVRVWQGSDGSNGPETSKLNSISYAPAGLTLASGDRVDIRGASLALTDQGNLQITDTRSNILWQSGTSLQCGGSCQAVFQNDGNLVLYGPANTGYAAYWTSQSSNNNLGSMTFSNHAPYLKILDRNGRVLWTAAD
jgi:beta-glucanase (GH16 family)